jgi:hypothetical protein
MPLRTQFSISYTSRKNLKIIHGLYEEALDKTVTKCTQQHNNSGALDRI